MLKDVVIHASQTVKFDVKIIGEPPPKKTWMFGNITLKDGGKINTENEPYRTKLCLINCDKRETGVYKIKAENSVGSDEATVELMVLGKSSYFDLLQNIHFLSNVPHNILTMRKEFNNF